MINAADIETIADRVAEQLVGTSRCSLGEVIEGLFCNPEFCAAFDQVAFRCSGCDWWCEIGEMAYEDGSEQLCSDCSDG